MNADRFDTMVQALTSARSRRTTLGGAFGAGLAALLGRAGSEDAAARKKRKNKNKKKRRKTCKKTCRSSTACEAASCTKKGKCKRTNQPDGLECGVDRDCCGGECRDLATDGANCGACEHDCLSGECERGACLCAGQQECPLGCYCFGRVAPDNGAVCIANGLLGGDCTSDDDCPFSTLCLLGGRCSTPCLL